jgi:hypothetical protein
LHTQTHYRESSARIARDARKLVPGLRVLAGGPDVTLFRHLPEGVDVAMTGEVERTVVDVVAAMLAGRDLSNLPGVIFRDGERIVRTEEFPVEENLGALPWPARHLVARRDYSLFGAFRGKSTSLITGRGCTGHCRFCARPAYAYFRYRPRPVDDVLDEIQSVYEQGTRFLYVTDDNPEVDFKNRRWIVFLPAARVDWRGHRGRPALSAFRLAWPGRRGAACRSTCWPWTRASVEQQKAARLDHPVARPEERPFRPRWGRLRFRWTGGTRAGWAPRDVGWQPAVPGGCQGSWSATPQRAFRK